MIVGASPERPTESTVGFGDGQVVDAGETAAHESVGVEFSVLVAVRAEPAARIVMPFVGETDGNPVVTERPQFLDETAVQFASHLRVRKRTISSRPARNSSRLRQTESGA